MELTGAEGVGLNELLDRCDAVTENKMAEYRIVRDGYAGYEVQKRTWWLPIWRQAGFCNTHRSIEAAREYAKVDAGQVVERLGHLRSNRY